MDSKPKKSSVDIFALLGNKPGEDEESDLDSGDLALKAAFKAIKADDFDGFKEAMTEWQTHCTSSVTDDSEDSDDSEDY